MPFKSTKRYSNAIQNLISEKVNYNMLANLLNSFFGGLQGNSPKPSVPICQEDKQKTNEIKEKYSEDITALTEKYGELKTDLCIEIELSELLNVLPRKRKRIDAYRGLISHLQEKYGVTLTIKSRKKNDCKTTKSRQ